MITGHDIVCASFGSWDDAMETPQQLMMRLAAHNRVFFMNQPVSPVTFTSGMMTRGAVASRLRAWRQGTRQVAPNIWVGQPPPILPKRSNKLMNVLNGVLLRRWLARETTALGFESPIYWNFQPWLPNLGRALKPSLSLYYCVDDFASAPYWWNAGGAVRAREDECCREADVVICTGRQLVDRRRPVNENVHFMAEGADVEAFTAEALSDAPPPDDIAKLPGRVVGYAGAINWRIDSELILYMAERQPDWSFALVGPVRPDLPQAERLQAVPNVHFLGNKPPAELPAYCKAMDVCLIPYVLNEYTHHIFPLKLYEYLAAGKPIVSTDMAEMRAYEGDEMAIGRSNEEFHRKVAAAMAEDTPVRAAARRQSARNESWDQRVEQISSLIAPIIRPWPGRGAATADGAQHEAAS
jgi:glycosyltransferase involved in cell wall biosynthesis